MDERQLKRIQQALGAPPEVAVAVSRKRVKHWFAQSAVLIQWDVIESPLGPLYIAASPKGLCSIDFGMDEAEFQSQLDPSARIEQNASALKPITKQLQEYFTNTHYRFQVPLDLDRLTPFQVTVLQTAQRIPPGVVWTYGQVAQAIGKPKASRAVGQALGRNPVPIVIPCHRVVASDGGLGGYSGGGGLASKRRLLALEGAL